MNAIKFLPLAVVIFLTGCGGAGQNEGLPEDITGLKALKDELSAELSATQAKLDEVTAKIEEIEPKKPAPAKLTVVEDVVQAEFKRFTKVQAVVESKDLVSVSAEMPGRLTKVTVEEGDYVKRGQLIASIDMESTRKQRLEVETQLGLAQDIYERQKRLWDQNIGSEVQYLQAKNNVERLEQTLETLDHSLSKSSIYAPLTGVIDMVNLKTGEIAQPGAPIVMILDTRNLKVVADVPESYLGKVQKNELVEVNFPALDKSIESPVTLIGRKIDPANRTFKVEIDLRAPDELIKPNLLAEVLINDYIEEDVVIISQELIQQEVGGRIYVMVVDETSGEPKASKRYITTGASFEGDVVVNSGLAAGDRLITTGSRGLTAGERISIVNPEIAADDE